MARKLAASVAIIVLASCAPQPPPMLDALTFYASFDKALQADRAQGAREVSTRYGRLDDPAGFTFQPGFPANAYRIAANAGISGGALEALDVLPDNGRVFFPAKSNLLYQPNGWQGAVSFWIKTNPDEMLKTPFCDPIQITEKGATNGGLWIDFPNTSPRDLRLGAFQSEGNGRERISEEDPNAPIGFKAGDWHHIAFNWKNFDTNSSDAEAELFIDANSMGKIENRNIIMDWQIEKTGIYLAVNYIGLLDELAIFNRPLTAPEIQQLQTNPAILKATTTIQTEPRP